MVIPNPAYHGLPTMMAGIPKQANSAPALPPMGMGQRGSIRRTDRGNAQARCPDCDTN